MFVFLLRTIPLAIFRPIFSLIIDCIKKVCEISVCLVYILCFYPTTTFPTSNDVFTPTDQISRTCLGKFIQFDSFSHNLVIIIDREWYSLKRYIASIITK